MRLRRVFRNDQLVLSFLALVVGLVAGGAIIIFREGVALVQRLSFGTGSEVLFDHVAALPRWQVIAVPVLGGLAVGLLIHFLLPGRRPVGVADIIEANALRGGRVRGKRAVVGAAVNAASIGVGGSVGREGPAVHLGAAIGAWIAERLHLTRPLSRTLLGCGAAAAVAASFNTPIAGALFANEVIVGHYALSAFAPVVIASVVGAVVSQLHFGFYPAFEVPVYHLTSLWELPAFAGLGVICGLVAVAFMRGVLVTQAGWEKLPFPVWGRPAVAGFALGLIALAFPQVFGVGYGTTDAALRSSLAFDLLLWLVVAKLVATVICLGSGWGGGVFSPSLMLGALVGGAFGLLAARLFPELSSLSGVYSIAGMGGVAAAVLGAPISTILIVFEMTRDLSLTLAVMVSVVLASVVAKQFCGGSFFAMQLEARGVDVRHGYEAALLRGITVRQVMTREAEIVTPDITLPEVRIMLQESATGGLFVVNDAGVLIGTITLADLSEAAFDPAVDSLINAIDVARLDPPVLAVADDLEKALQVMRDNGADYVAVIDDQTSRRFVGCARHRDVLDAFNQALLEVRREEHG